MIDIPYNNELSLSDFAFAARIGNFIKHHRLLQNRTQQEVASAAGISRSTLSLLEKGETVSVATLIQVLRVLDQLHVLKVFEINDEISPLVLAKIEKSGRQRAGRKTIVKTDTKNTDW